MLHFLPSPTDRAILEYQNDHFVIFSVIYLIVCLLSFLLICFNLTSAFFIPIKVFFITLIVFPMQYYNAYLYLFSGKTLLISRRTSLFILLHLHLLITGTKSQIQHMKPLTQSVYLAVFLCA